MSQTQRRVAPGHSNRGRLATVMIATLIALFLVTVGSNAPTEAAFPGDNGNLTYLVIDTQHFLHGFLAGKDRFGQPAC